MTRTYALKRLLEHGPMTQREIRECTRWTARTTGHALETLLAQGRVRRSHLHGGRGGVAYVAVGV